MTEYSPYRQSLDERQIAALQSCEQACARTSRRLIFTLSTALALLGIEPPNTSKTGRKSQQPDVVQAVVQHERDRWRVKGVQFITWYGDFETVALQHGKICCVHPLYVWAMFATRVSLEELVVLGDSMMRRHVRGAKGLKLDNFQELLCDLRKDASKHNTRLPRGYHAMEKALKLMRENTDSSQETRLRLLLMRYGLDCPEVNVPIQVPDSGIDRLLYLDMAYPEQKVAVEYDGLHHRDQWVADSDRLKCISAAGWQHIQVTLLDFSNEEKKRRLVALVAQKLGTVPLEMPLTLEQLADGRRRWHHRSGHDA